jgi:hypothetical protein
LSRVGRTETGNPQPGQAVASVETCFPHSGQLVNAMGDSRSIVSRNSRAGLLSGVPAFPAQCSLYCRSCTLSNFGTGLPGGSDFPEDGTALVGGRGTAFVPGGGTALVGGRGVGFTGGGTCAPAVPAINISAAIKLLIFAFMFLKRASKVPLEPPLFVYQVRKDS